VLIAVTRFLEWVLGQQVTGPERLAFFALTTHEWVCSLEVSTQPKRSRIDPRSAFG